MSLTKSTTARRRLALFTSASTAAAGVAVAASLGVLLAPGQALAQCAPAAPAPGQGADVINCASSTTTYGPTGTNGIVFTSEGDLTVNVTGSAGTNLGSGGVALTAGDADDNLTFNRTGGPISGSGNTAQAIVDLQSQNGDIRMDTDGSISGSTSAVQYGVRAVSSGAGDIHITSSASGTAAINVGTGATNPGIAGIYAAGNGGDIRLESTGAGVGNVGLLSGSGRLFGVQASTTGSGSLYFRGTGTSGSSGTAALDFATGTGSLTVETVGTGNVTSSSPTGIGVRLTTRGGDAVLSRLGNGSISGGGNNMPGSTAVQVDMTGGTTTINNVSTSGGFGGSNANARANGLLRGIGTGSIVFNNTGAAAYGRIDLSDFAGDFTFTNQADDNGWATLGLNEFAGGKNTIVNAGGVMVMGTTLLPGVSMADREATVTTTTLRFGASEDRFENAGTLAIGPVSTTGSNRYILGVTLSVEGLETFNNSGDILLGTPTATSTINARVGQTATDGYWDDMLVLQDSHWTGLDGSRVFVDAFFNGVGQESCTRSTDIAEGVVIPTSNLRAGHFAANDCLDFQGSRVSGQTEIAFNNALPGDRGAYNPRGNVVVDVRGGIVDSPDAFVLSSASWGYNPDVGGGVIDQGLFVYALGFEGEDGGEGGQFKLYGIAAPTVQQFPLIAHAAGELWRGTTAGWIDRRNEQRAEGELRTGLWIRGRATSADRTSVNVVMAGDVPYTFDNSFTQDDRSLTVGLDFGGDAFGGAEWVAGAMFGYARGMLGYDSSPNVADLEGAHAGLYAGFTAGGFFQDLVINGTWLEMDNDAPSLNLQPLGTVLSTPVQTIGGQFETGWRFGFGPVSVEPLASVTWLRTSFDDMNVPADDPTRLGGDVSFDDSRSLRAGLGVRLGMSDIAPTLLPVGFTVTAKAMEEWDGEATVRVVNVGPDPAVVTNTFDGTFNELTGTVTLGDGSGHVSGFVSIGGVWGDDYEAQTGSLGVRLSW